MAGSFGTIKDSTAVYVFGSNRAGRHWTGAALYARQQYGAIYGQGEGLQGQSYGIPIKDGRLRTLPLEQIRTHINRFLAFAGMCDLKGRPLHFNVTAIGCRLAGYCAKDIAPLFEAALDLTNVTLPEEFIDILYYTEFNKKGLKVKLDFIRDNLARNKSVGWIARALRVSPRGLYYLIKTHQLAETL